MVVMDADSGNMLNYLQLIQHRKYKKGWNKSLANEFGRLANGVGRRIKDTTTIKFIHREDVPRKRMKDVTYGQLVCSMGTKKAELNRTIFTMGSNHINYPGKVATPMAEMLVDKLLFNSVISTKDARFITMYTSNFYFMTPLKRPKYNCINLRDIPEEIIKEYHLKAKAKKDGSI